MIYNNINELKIIIALIKTVKSNTDNINNNSDNNII